MVETMLFRVYALTCIVYMNIELGKTASRLSVMILRDPRVGLEFSRVVVIIRASRRSATLRPCRKIHYIILFFLHINIL